MLDPVVVVVVVGVALTDPVQWLEGRSIWITVTAPSPACISVVVRLYACV